MGEEFGEATRSGAVDGACEFTQQMPPALEKAVETPDMTPELAAILRTRPVPIEYRVETSVNAPGAND